MRFDRVLLGVLGAHYGWGCRPVPCPLVLGCRIGRVQLRSCVLYQYPIMALMCCRTKSSNWRWMLRTGMDSRTGRCGSGRSFRPNNQPNVCREMWSDGRRIAVRGFAARNMPVRKPNSWSLCGRCPCKECVRRRTKIRTYRKVLVGMTIFVLLDVVILSQSMSVAGDVRRCGCSCMRVKL